MFKKLRISQKLVVFMVLIGVIPLLLGIIFANIRMAGQLETEAFAKLEAVHKIKVKQIIDWFENLDHAAGFLTTTEIVRSRFDTLKAYHDEKNVGAHDSFPVNTPEYRNMWNQMSDKMIATQKTYRLEDMYIICAAHGHVMYSNEKKSDLGQNLSSGKFRDSGLAIAWSKAIQTGKTVFVDFEVYAPAGNKPASFAAKPFYDTDGKLLGVMALQIPLEEINNIMQERAGMGESGETYLVGPDKRMRSDSIIDKSGNHSVIASFSGTVAANGCDTEAVRLVFQEKNDKKIIKDYNGNSVLSVFAPVQIGNDFTWALMAEIDKSEALAPANQLRTVLIFMLVILALIVAGVGYMLARSISKPIDGMVNRTRDLAKGEADLTKRIKIDSQDELGELGGHFNEFIQRIQQLIQKVKTNADNVSSASLEISSSSEQLAATVEEQSTQSQSVSSAVTQLTATSDDISKSIENTRNAAEESATMTRDGGKIIQQSIEALKSIEEQTTNLGRIIANLGGSTQKIGNIINVINDVADQTNLLALNAAIEAARAGDAGRGFAVVADEVRKLAERTAKATKEIEQIITQLRQEANNAEKAMDDAAAEVEKGSGLGRESLQILDKIVVASDNISDAAIAVASAITQENATIEEIGNNVQGIAAASEQSANAVQEVASTAEDLSRQAEALKSMVDQFIT